MAGEKGRRLGKGCSAAGLGAARVPPHHPEGPDWGGPAWSGGRVGEGGAFPKGTPSLRKGHPPWGEDRVTGRDT